MRCRNAGGGAEVCRQDKGGGWVIPGGGAEEPSQPSMKAGNICHGACPVNTISIVPLPH